MHAFKHVIAVGRLVTLDFSANVLLPRAQFLALLDELFLAQQTIEPVIVHLVDAILELGILLVEPLQGLLMVFTLFFVIVLQDAADVVEMVGGKHDGLEHLEELIRDLLLPHVLDALTFALRSGAVIVHILALLQLRTQQTAAMTAPKHPLERPVVLLLA